MTCSRTALELENELGERLKGPVRGIAHKEEIALLSWRAPAKAKVRASLAFIRINGVVPPGLAQLICLPSAEALGLIVSSSGLGPCFTSDRDGVSSWGPGRCCILGTRPLFHARDQAGVASSGLGRRCIVGTRPVFHPRDQAGVSWLGLDRRFHRRN